MEMATSAVKPCGRTIGGEGIVIALFKILVGTREKLTFLMESCRSHCQRRLHPDIIDVRDETLSGEWFDKLILVKELPSIHGAAVCAGA